MIDPFSGKEVTPEQAIQGFYAYLSLTVEGLRTKAKGKTGNKAERAAYAEFANVLESVGAVFALIGVQASPESLQPDQRAALVDLAKRYDLHLPRGLDV